MPRTETMPHFAARLAGAGCLVPLATLRPGLSLTVSGRAAMGPGQQPVCLRPDDTHRTPDPEETRIGAYLPRILRLVIRATR